MGKVGGKFMIPIFDPLATYFFSTESPIGLTTNRKINAAAAVGAFQMHQDFGCRTARIIGIALRRYACQIGKPGKITL
jgi:hypothetical protein